MKRNVDYFNNLPYKTEIYYEKDDNSWIAFHPELGKASCYAIGSSKQEALTSLDEERKSFIELLLNEGKEIPLPIIEDEDLPSGQFVLRIPRSLHKKVKDISQTENISINQFVLYALSEKVGKIEGLYISNFLSTNQNVLNTVKMDFAENSLWNAWGSFYNGTNKPQIIDRRIGTRTCEFYFNEKDIIYFRTKDKENVANS